MSGEMPADSVLFVLSFLLGFVFGLFYEFFRFIRLAFPHNLFSVAAEDILFFIPVTVVFVFFTFCFSDGIIRWFSPVGALLGFLLYLKTLGRFLRLVSDKILFAIRAFLRFVFRKLLLPVIRLIQKIFKKLFTVLKKFVIIIKTKADRRKSKQLEKRFLSSAKKGFNK